MLTETLIQRLGEKRLFLLKDCSASLLHGEEVAAAIRVTTSVDVVFGEVRVERNEAASQPAAHAAEE